MIVYMQMNFLKTGTINFHFLKNVYFHFNKKNLWCRNIMLESPHILIVDDNDQNLLLLKRLLEKNEYQVTQANNGADALNKLTGFKPDLILLDVMMPELDGYETCQIIKETETINSIPVIFLTAKIETEDITKGFELGGVDYITKPFNSRELLSRVKTHVEMNRLRTNLEGLVDQRTREVAEAYKKLKDTHLEILKRLGRAAEFRDNETAQHLKRISYYTEILAKELEYDDATAEIIMEASVMHDIGKIGIPDVILLKPGKLSEEEFEIMKKHPKIGAELLTNIDSDLLKMAEIIANTHHERWDGTGYPNGLKGKNIPLEGRIVTIVDVFDALTSQRPYKEAWPLDEARKYINDNSGTMFDPEIVAIFEKNFDKIAAIRNKFQD